MRLYEKLVILALILALGALAGCLTPAPFVHQIPTGQAEDWVRSFGKYKIQMLADTSHPKADQDIFVEFILQDTSQQPPAPVRGAYLTCAARMPNIPGHSHPMRIRSDFTGNIPGHYRPAQPMRFELGGRWDIIVHAKMLDDYEFSAVFPVEVEGPPWPPNFISKPIRQALLP